MASMRKFDSLTLGALVTLAACGEGAPDDNAGRRGGESRSVQVVTEFAVAKQDTDRVEAIGTARAQASAVIFPETGGEVTEVRFSSGDKVEKGQILVRLDAREERLAVRRADLAVTNAQQLIDRYNRITVPGAISESQVDEAQTALDAARIDLELARVRLSDRDVRAPFAGYVGLTDIDAGARITPQTPITQLDDRSRLFVDFAAPEQVFGDVVPGDRLPIEPFSAPETELVAEILTIGNSIDAETRTFTIRAALDNTDDRLRPGMSFRVNFSVPGETYPSVPEAAIAWGGDGAYVWTVQAGKAKRTPVDIVSRDAGTVLVRGALDTDAVIVVEGIQKVRDGTPVSPLSRDRREEPRPAAPDVASSSASTASQP